MPQFARIGLVGAGAWGVALANVAAGAGRATVLWGRDPQAMRNIALSRLSPRLPDAALAAANRNTAFIDRFWGYEPRRSANGATSEMRNGAHVGNRVGHAQGGLLVGLGATTAMAALPSSWALTSITACFVSPGDGASLHAKAALTHRGRETAVARVEVTGLEGRRVLEVLTTHARRRGKEIGPRPTPG